MVNPSSLNPVEPQDNNFGNHSMREEIRKGITFTGLRYFDNAVWLGGIASGMAIQNKTGMPAAVVAPGVAAGVTAVEYTVSGKAVKLFKTDEESDESMIGNKGALLKETFALGYAAWAGSTSTVEANNSLGLESNRVRRLGQAAMYGIGTSLWTTNIPLFKQGREGLGSSLDYLLESPVKGTAIGISVSLGIYGVLKGIKSMRQRWQNTQESKQTEDNA